MKYIGIFFCVLFATLLIVLMKITNYNLTYKNDVYGLNSDHDDGSYANKNDI